MHSALMSNRIKALRKKLGTPNAPIAQAELAARLRVNQSTVSRLENGDLELDGPILTAVEALEASARVA